MPLFSDIFLFVLSYFIFLYFLYEIPADAPANAINPNTVLLTPVFGNVFPELDAVVSVVLFGVVVLFTSLIILSDVELFPPLLLLLLLFSLLLLLLLLFPVPVTI